MNMCFSTCHQLLRMRNWQNDICNYLKKITQNLLTRSYSALLLLTIFSNLQHHTPKINLKFVMKQSKSKRTANQIDVFARYFKLQHRTEEIEEKH